MGVDPFQVEPYEWGEYQNDLKLWEILEHGSITKYISGMKGV